MSGALERAIIAAGLELDRQEMVLTDPMTLRRLQFERVARAVLMAVREPDEAVVSGMLEAPILADDHTGANVASMWSGGIAAILGEGEGE